MIATNHALRVVECWRQGEILASIGLAGGLKASIMLSACCLELWAALASSLMDEQLFGK